MKSWRLVVRVDVAPCCDQHFGRNCTKKISSSSLMVGICHLTYSHHYHHGQKPTRVGICHGGNLLGNHQHGSRIGKNGSRRTKNCVLDQRNAIFVKKKKHFVEIGLGACRQCYRATMNCATGGPKDILAFTFFYLVMTLMI